MLLFKSKGHVTCHLFVKDVGITKSISCEDSFCLFFLHVPLENKEIFRVYFDIYTIIVIQLIQALLYFFMYASITTPFQQHGPPYFQNKKKTFCKKKETFFCFICKKQTQFFLFNNSNSNKSSFISTVDR